MKRFKYIHEGILHESTLEHFLDRGTPRYRVTSPDGIAFGIAPCGAPGPTGKLIWLQFNDPGELEFPHHLVQSIGEGLENAWCRAIAFGGEQRMGDEVYE